MFALRKTDSRHAAARTIKPARATIPAAVARPGTKDPAITLARAAWSQPMTQGRPSTGQDSRSDRDEASKANGILGKPSKSTPMPSPGIGSWVRGRVSARPRGRARSSGSSPPTRGRPWPEVGGSDGRRKARYRTADHDDGESDDDQGRPSSPQEASEVHKPATSPSPSSGVGRSPRASPARGSGRGRRSASGRSRRDSRTSRIRG